MTSRSLQVTFPFSSLSILDRAQLHLGQSDAGALQSVVQRAQRAETLGYHRFWVAEHHGVPGIAGSVPAILAAAVIAATSTIRVGTGGIMLPNHQPLVVAEQAATLALLSDGRFDLGVGRSLGFTPAVRSALRAETKDAGRFENDVEELLEFLDGSAPITAQPQVAGRLPVFVLATGHGMEIAARAGLAVVVGGPALSDERNAALERYRSEFRPSSWWSRPYVSVSLNVAVSDTTSAARNLLLPEARALAASRTKGYFPPLDPGLNHGSTTREQTLVEESLTSAVYGTPQDVERQLIALQARTGADELLVSGGMADPEGRARSDELLAELAAS